MAPEHLEKLRDILALLDRSRRPQDLDLPGLRLHRPLKGGLKGHFAVLVSGDWRVTFRFEEGRRRLSRLSLGPGSPEVPVRNPRHPGGVVRRQCLQPLGLSVTEAARGLGVTRQALSELVNEKAGISVEMAIRLSKAFGSSPETWLGMQMAYDLWQARDRIARIEVRRFQVA